MKPNLNVAQSNLCFITKKNNFIFVTYRVASVADVVDVADEVAVAAAAAPLDRILFILVSFL